jgi:outer membrane protein assembly factor BamB
VTSASPASPYELLVLDADTGAVRARHALPANPALGGIAVAGGMVVVCCEDGAVLGFGAAN